MLYVILQTMTGNFCLPSFLNLFNDFLNQNFLRAGHN